MRRAASTRAALHSCQRKSAPHLPSHNPPPPRRTFYQMAGERLPPDFGVRVNGTLNQYQSKRHAEKLRRDSAEISMQKRILNLRPWKRDYTLLHAMAFVRELERRYGRVSHIYLVKDPVNPRDYQQQFTVVFEDLVPAMEIHGLRKGAKTIPVLTAKWSSELETDASQRGGPSLASLREYLAHTTKCEEKLSNNYGVTETDAIEATLHLPSKFFFLQGKQAIPLIPRPIRNRFIQSLLDFGGFASNPTQQMQSVLEFHKENLQRRGHVNDAWEEAFKSDTELRDTRHALSRIVHGLSKAAQLHEIAKDKIASVASQGDYHDLPVQDLLDGTELADLSLGASESKEDISLLEALAPHAREAHIDDPLGEAEDRIPYDVLATEAYGVLGEEDTYISGRQGENAQHSPSREQLLQLTVKPVGAGDPPSPMISPPFDGKTTDQRRQQIQLPLRHQLLQLGSATEGLSFRKFETPPPLTEDDDINLGGTWLEDAHGARVVNDGRQHNYFAGGGRRVYDDRPWPEPLPASAFSQRPREVLVETPGKAKKQEGVEERAVVRTLRKRLLSFLDGTEA